MSRVRYMRDCPPIPEGRSPKGMGGCAKTFSGSMVLDSNPAAERRGKAPCKSNVHTVGFIVSTRPARAGRRRQWTATELVRQARQRFPLWGRAKIRAVLARARLRAQRLRHRAGRAISVLLRARRAQAAALRRPRAKTRPNGPDRPHERRHRGQLRGQGVRDRLPAARHRPVRAAAQKPQA